MKLITETLDANTHILESSDGLKKNYFIEGIYLQSEVINGNGRLYPESVMDSAVAKYMPLIAANRALGELNHPPTPAINYERAAIKTISLIKEGNNYIGKSKLLSTPLGELLKGLVDDGVQLAVSSRGLGSIKETKGVSIVQDDFTLSAAADVVSDPSAPDAFVQGIIEGSEWVYGEGGILIEQKLEDIQKLAETNAKQLEARKLEIFTDYIKLLSK